MSIIRIRDIKPRESVGEIRIRVIRKWIPYSKKEDISYLFVDIHGDAIEATAKLAKERYFDSMIKLNSCYAISDYLSLEARNHMQVVTHKASIRLGEATTFPSIEEPKIPAYYYNFATYELLKERLHNHKLLTDYIGRIERISGVLTRQEKLLRKVTVLDISNNLIELTFWNEKINEVTNDDTIGKVLAVTSTKVTEYYDRLQLESTPATHTYIDSPLPNLPYYINRFKEIDQTSKPILTLADLLSKVEEQNMQHQALCEATVTSIETGRPWYYVNCNTCNEKAHMQKANHYYYVCEDHGEKQGFKYMYCVNTTIADATSSTKAVFFNEAITGMLNMTCEDMVVKHKYYDPKILPEAILNIQGIPYQLHLTVKKDGSISVNKAEKQTRMTPITPDPKMVTRKRHIHELPAQEGPTKKAKS